MRMTEDERNNNNEESGDFQHAPPTLLSVIGSVLAAGFGVQSSKNRERDFKHGRATVFLTVGLLFTLLFLGSLLAIVALVVRNAA